MSPAAGAATAVVAALHALFLVLEMFLWDTPAGHRVFKLRPPFAKESRALAANQGLYNGFLAAGLAYSLWLGAAGLPMREFLLCCVIVAGVFGAATASRTILMIQALPGAVALALSLLSK